jgi:hypothetical protein
MYRMTNKGKINVNSEDARGRGSFNAAAFDVSVLNAA